MWSYTVSLLIATEKNPVFTYSVFLSGDFTYAECFISIWTKDEITAVDLWGF